MLGGSGSDRGSSGSGSGGRLALRRGAPAAVVEKGAAPCSQEVRDAADLDDDAAYAELVAAHCRFPAWVGRLDDGRGRGALGVLRDVRYAVWETHRHRSQQPPQQQQRLEAVALVPVQGAAVPYAYENLEMVRDLERRVRYALAHPPADAHRRPPQWVGGCVATTADGEVQTLSGIQALFLEHFLCTAPDRAAAGGQQQRCVCDVADPALRLHLWTPPEEIPANQEGYWEGSSADFDEPSPYEQRASQRDAKIDAFIARGFERPLWADPRALFEQEPVDQL